MWKCNSCGYVWDGEEPLEACPKCEAGAAKFVELDAIQPLLDSREGNGAVTVGSKMNSESDPDDTGTPLTENGESEPPY